MTRYLLNRLGQFAAVLFIAVTINFLLPRAMPGSPLSLLAGEEAGSLTGGERERLLREAGLDRPLHEQYLRYLGDLARGDLGASLSRRQPVMTILLDRLPWTLLLTGTALLLATAIGVIAGAIVGWRRGGALDVGALGLFLVLESMPAFWLAMLAIAIFAVQIPLFPTFGARDVAARLDGIAYWLDVAHHLVLPVTVLTLVSVSAVFLTMRANMTNVLGEEYIQVARAKGLAGRQVLFRHALPNAILPVATITMLNLGQLVAGATVIETVFSYPGLGRMMYEAATTRDYPLLQGGFLLLTVSVVLANLASDLIYPLLDPRVTRG